MKRSLPFAVKSKIFYQFLLVVLIIQQPVSAQKGQPKPPLYVEKGKLYYTPDSLGNRIPDFSYCGYKAGEQTIPFVEVKVIVPASTGDATGRIQSAIDYVAKLPVDANGFRGAVLLGKGVFNVGGSLMIKTPGIIIRGSGTGDEGTTIIGVGKDRATLITISGKDNRSTIRSADIIDNYVPVNANSIRVSNITGFSKGDNILITRHSTKEWIDLLGTDHFGGGITALGWKPGQRDIEWVRTISAIDGDKITFDAPVTTALDKEFGVGTVSSFSWPDRVTNCGIENLRLISEYDRSNEKDEAHRWMAIVVDNAADCWVRRVNFEHFAGSAVAVYDGASKVTVEDCISLAPVSEIGGERRNTFFTSGQQTLIQRCYAEYGMHDFATGFCAPGPNAFVQCESKLPYSYSGGIDSWSSGVLFDVCYVDGNAISYRNLGQDRQGAGWNIANSVFWNCSAARIDCYQPPGAQNWAFGTWSQFQGDGYWAESNNSIEPRSLYYAQLKERIGQSVNSRVQVMDIGTEASSSPSVEVAAELTKLAYTPAQTLIEFISASCQKDPINTDSKGARTIDDIGIEKNVVAAKVPSLHIQNGWLARGDKIITGFIASVPWWNGTAKPYGVDRASMAITRYVPGRVGNGLTDDLEEVTDSMMSKHITAMDQNYGLWYERRRDDHERIRRMDGDVWPPFYELPFARSGKGTAWDGLSKYDLTKYNHWYWDRLKKFADLADQKGLLLIYENYFQHNIIEAGAHYADFPWRPANNINNTGFPEPVPYAGDKRIFMAEQFYDTTQAVRRELHKKYIRQCLDNFSDNNGVIQMIGEEFTGPLHFVQFWLNNINEWEKENGKKELIGLSTTKDVQDAILNDPYYSSLVDVINIKYWYYQANGEVYAPKGGQNLAPRQHARLLKPKATSPQQVYNAVLEYKLEFPDKAIIYSSDAWDKNGWAVLMAGGSLPNVNVKDDEFLKAVADMQAVSNSVNNGRWILKNERTGLVIFDMSNKEVSVDLSGFRGNYEVKWINTKNGEVEKNKQPVKAGKTINLLKPKNGEWVLWLKRK